MTKIFMLKLDDKDIDQMRKAFIKRITKVVTKSTKGNPDPEHYNYSDVDCIRESLLHGFYDKNDVPLTSFEKWPVIELIGQFEERK